VGLPTLPPDQSDFFCCHGVKMSISIMSQVWKLQDLDGSSLLLMLAIADMANDDGVCWPGIKHLASKVRLKERQTINLINELIERGYLERKRRQSTSNVYQINMGAIFRTCNEMHSVCAEDCTPNVQPIALKSSVNHKDNHQIDDAAKPPRPSRKKPTPEETALNAKAKSLIDEFIELSSLKPVSPADWGKWQKMAKYLAGYHVEPPDIRAAYYHERQYGKNPISWIGSIKARAISQHREQ